jgi:hypothetical protein
MNLSPTFCRIFPFAIYIGFFAVGGAFEFLHGQGAPFLENWDPRWLYPTKTLLVLLALIWLWRNFTELANPSDVKPIDWVIGVVTGVVVFVLWINLAQDWATIGQSAGYNPTDPQTGQPDWTLVAIRIFGAAMVVPVMEELFWRSFVMRWISQQEFLRVDPARVGAKAFFITAVLFASEHSLWLAGLLAGVAYNWLYMRSRNLWVPVVAHAVTNGLLGFWVVQTHNWQFW